MAAARAAIGAIAANCAADGASDNFRSWQLQLQLHGRGAHRQLGQETRAAAIRRAELAGRGTVLLERACARTGRCCFKQTIAGFKNMIGEPQMHDVTKKCGWCCGVH